MSLRRFSALVAVAAGTIVLAAAQQKDAADAIVARNTSAKGGLEKIKALTSLKQTAIVVTNGMEMPLTIYSKRPNLIRQEITVGDRLVVNAFDGQVPWILNPLLGPQQTKPIIISGPQAEQTKADSNFDGPLLDYRAQGYTAAIDKPETTPDGLQLAHLRLTASTGRVLHIYLSTKTWLDVRHVTVTPQGRLEQQFDDYRLVEGFTMPFRIRMLVNGVQQSEIRVEKLEFNTTMDDALFRLPK